MFTNDFVITGFISNLKINDDKDLVYFNVSDVGKHSILKDLKCYMVGDSNRKITIFDDLDLSKEYCFEGCLCSTAEKTDFQVHCLYLKPEKLYA